MTLPYILGPLLLPRLARLQARHPGLTLHVRLGDRLSRLVDEQIDVALRIGELEDSSLVGQLLLRTRWVTLASPAYLARHGTPEHPDALVDHQCLKFILPRGTAREWVFRREPGGPTETVRTGGTIYVDHGPALLDLAAAGAGLSARCSTSCSTIGSGTGGSSRCSRATPPKGLPSTRCAYPAGSRCRA